MGARAPRIHAGGPEDGPLAGGAVSTTGSWGTGPNSAVMVRIWLVLVSRVRVFARAGVATVCSTEKLLGEFSLITVSVPSPCELNASIVAGLNTAPSQPLPMGRSVIICPSVADRMIMFFLSRHAAKRILFCASNARPAHPPPLLETSYLPTIFIVAASMTAIA